MAQFIRNRQSQQNLLSESLLGRIIPILAGGLTVLAIIAIAVVITTNQTNLAEEHSDILNSGVTLVQQELNRYVQDVTSLARSNEMPYVIEGYESILQVASTNMQTLLQNNPYYLSARFVDAEGDIRLEVRESMGQPTISNIPPGGLYDAVIASLPEFQEAITTGGVVVGNYRTSLTDRGVPFDPPRAQFDIYVPITDEIGSVVGALQVIIDARQLTNFINNAELEDSLIQSHPSHNLLLLANNNTILADSKTLGSDYLANLRPEGGNYLSSSFYTQIATELANNPDNLLLTHIGNNLVSATSINIPGVTNLDWRIVLTHPLVDAYLGSIIAVLLIATAVTVTGFAASVVLRNYLEQITHPITEANILMRQLAQGHSPSASGQYPVTTEPEESDLVNSTQLVANRIASLNQNLVTQIARRNRDMRVAGRLGHEMVTIDDLETLVYRAINLICSNLGYYHAQVYFLDDLGENAILTYSRGEVGQQLLAKGHRIPINTTTNSLVGTAARERQPAIVEDTQAENVPHMFNPLLPETRSELALPLLIGSEIIGVLDIQSHSPHSFSQEDLPTFQLIADQFAIAVYNARLKDETRARVDEIEILNRQLTRDAWAQYNETAEVKDRFGRDIEDQNNQMSAPIRIRDEVIGSLDVALPANNEFSEDDALIVQAVAERVALAMENARLFQETQFTLSETSALYYLSSQLNAAESLDDVLHAIINGIATDASQIHMWLFDVDPHDGIDQMTIATLSAMTGHPNQTLAIGDTLEMSGTEFYRNFNPADISIHDNDDVDEMHPLLVRNFSLTTLGTVICVPLNVRGTWRGFINIGYDTYRLINQRETRIFRSLISQVSVAIDNRVLFEQIEAALLRNEKLYIASRVINASQTIEETLQAAIVTNSDRRLHYWIALSEGPRDAQGWPEALRFVAYTSNDQIVQINDLIIMGDMSEVTPLLEGDYVIVDSETLNRVDNAVVAYLREKRQIFAAVFPLITNQTLIGVFLITAVDPITVSNEDIEAFLAISSQMGTQIENKNLLDRTEAALNEARRLYAVSRAIASAQDQTTIYETLAHHLSSPLLDAQQQMYTITISLLLAEPQPTENAPYLRYAFQWSSDPDIALEPAENTEIQHTEAPFADFIQDSNGLYHSSDPLPHSSTATIEAILAAYDGQETIVTSLSSGRKWFGVLIVRSTKEGILNEAYLRYLETISTLLSAALDRQSLLTASENERRNLDAILARMPTGVIVFEPDNFTPIQYNSQAEQLLHQPISTMQPFDPQQYGMYRTGTNLPYPINELALYVSRRTQEPTTNDDIAIIGPDYQIDMLMNAAPIYNVDGSLRGIVTALQDISNIRSLENTLQETLRETVTMYEAQRAMTEAESLEDLLDTLSMHLMLLETANAHIILRNEETDMLEEVRSLGMPIPSIEALAPILSDFDPFTLNDVVQDQDLSPEIAQLLAEMEAQTILSVPLRSSSRNRPMGWLILTNTEPYSISPETERSLLSIGDIAATALDNRLLVQSTQHALRQTAQLYSAATDINSATDALSLMTAIADALRDIQPGMFAIYMEDQISGAMVEMASEGFDESVQNGLNMPKIARIPIRDANGLYIEDIATAELNAIGEELLNGKNIAAFAALDLRVQDLPGGRIMLGYEEPYHFTEDTKRLLNTIVTSASVVLDNQMLLEQVQQTLNETSTLYQASRALTEAENVQQIVDVVVNYLIEPHVTQVFIALLSHTGWHDSNATLEIAASWSADHEIELMGVSLTPEQFPAWDLLATDSVITINDIYDESLELDMLQRASIESLDARSVVLMPLRMGRRGLGAIWIGSREPFEYTAQHERIFQSFAEQTSLSLETSRLMAQTERRARQLETSAEISQRASQLLDLDVLLPQVVDLIKSQFGYDHVQVFMMDEAYDWAILRASTGEAGEKLLNAGHKLRRGSDSVIGQVTETGQPTIALDTAEAGVVHRANPILPLTRSEMALPLTIKGRVLGALDVQSNQPNAFLDEDIQVLRTLAAQIAVAIDNANLYEEAQHRASDMSFLFDMTTSAASAETLNDALNTISQRLKETLQSDAVAIYLPQLYVDYNDNAFSTMKAVAGKGYEGELGDLEETRLDDMDNLVSVATHSRRPLVISDVHKEALYHPMRSDARSAILVPIISGPELVGLMAMEDKQVNAYDNTVVTLLLTLAGSLAAIIQNTLLVEKLQQSNEQLRELDRIKSQFLAAMSHELRTPLNSIIGFSRVMLKGIDGPLTEMQEQDLTTIYNSGNHLLNLINDILDQAKIEANKMTLKLDYFEVKPMIESVKSMTIGLLKEKPSLDLRVEVAPNMPKAYGDEFRTRQILINLTNNAVKFTNEGTITVRAYSVEQNGAMLVRVDVIDTGIGIADADIPILFEQFRQVDNSLTRTAGGTGLGLPLSKSLAELQGGRLTVASEVNIGSTFSVTIPTVPTVDEEGKRESEKDEAQVAMARPLSTGNGKSHDNGTSLTETKPPANPAHANGNGNGNGASKETHDAATAVTKREKHITQDNIPALPAKRDVLLIEDDKIMVDQYRKVLQRNGYEVYTADHAAYAQAMASNLRPTVIVMDVNFGNGQGWDILAQLKERDDTFDIPIVIASLDSDTERAYRLGAHTFLARPFMPDDLLVVVQEAEKESQRERILIIDDQPESVRLLEQLLNEHGNYRVFSAVSGQEGISLVARRQPNLIILDLRMPGMDGFKVLNELRANPETQNIPVIVVTGDIDLTADEQAQLQNLQLLHKTAISQQEYEAFLGSVQAQLGDTTK